MIRIGIILGSTRPGRNGEAVAKWVYKIGAQRKDAQFELVDIKNFSLPLLDEQIPPSMGQYSQAHTKKCGDCHLFVGRERWITMLFLQA